jgi:hypothetical protein
MKHYNLKVAIVGFGRSGTHITKEILKNLYNQKGRPVKNITNKHWYSKGDEKMANILISCRRDLRDVLASGYRNIHTSNNNNYLVSEMNPPYPLNFRIWKDKWGIPERDIIDFGKKHLKNGWDDWMPYVNYIFHYEAYMENPQKIIQELADLVKIKNPNITEAIQATKDFLKRKPSHQSPTKGKSNAWGDIFSKAQEKVIIDNFGYWLRNYNYIK